MVKWLKRGINYVNRQNAEKRLEARLQRFYHNQNIPWSDAYSLHKWKSIETAINSKEILELFAESKALPNGYGWRLDERIVEYPWLLAHLEQSMLTTLDAGSALNHLHLVTALLNL